MRRSVSAAILSAAAVLALAGCSSGTDTAETPPSDATSASIPAPVLAPSSDDDNETEDTAAETTTTTEAVESSTQASTAIMPDVVCMNLQAAQNRIQEAGVFFSRSEDATGQGRAQILDRNWVVVSQTPDPGTEFGEGEAVLSAVKIGEPGSC
ncbi:hypothetical protein GCM10023197_32330 [Gordonia humi]